jgi:ATP-dependent DNA helicase RecG
MLYPEHESSTLEFKKSIPKNDQLVKTMIGFCNQNGGRLIIGVSNDRKIIGVNENEINELMEYIEKSIFESTYPLIIPRISIQRIDNKSILIIAVSAGMNKPYYKKSEGMIKGTYIRLGRSTLRATDNVIDELQWQTRGLDYDKMLVYQANENDLDKNKIEKFFSKRLNKGKHDLSENILKSYHLIGEEHSKIFPTISGLLLFGNNPQQHLSEAMIICSHFKGNSGREAIATVDCENTLFQQFDQAYDFVLSRLNKSFVIKEVKREEKWEIPVVALREALLNAIVHRNYHIKGPTKIAIYNNRIEIFSPGLFPGLIKNLKLGITYLRNPNICKIFREADYIEKLGTGLITIFDSYEKYRLKEPQIIEGENFVKCILPRGEEKQEKSNLDDYAKIMNLFEKQEEITIVDIVNLLSFSKATAVRRINKLISDGLVLSSGKTRAQKYKKR